MFKSVIAGFVYPVSRKAGETVDCVVSIRNDGDDEGWFHAAINFWTGSEWLNYYSEWDLIMPGATKPFAVQFVMPQGDAYIQPWAGWWDVAAQATVWDASLEPVTIKLAGAVTLGPAKAVIVSYKVPESARSGDKVIVLATLRNDGESWGYCQAAAAYFDSGAERWAESPWSGLFHGDTSNLTLEFPMPPASTDLIIYARHWDFDLSMWIHDASSPRLNVALDASEWLHLELPAAVVSALDTGWANITAGEWANIFGLKIPPFSFEPGRWTLKAANFIIDGVNWIGNKLKETWDNAGEALRHAGSALSKIDDWLTNAYSWWHSRISDWWSSTWTWVNDNIIARLQPLWDNAAQLLSDITRVQGNVDGLGDSTRSWQSWLLGSMHEVPVIGNLITAANEAKEFMTFWLPLLKALLLDFPDGFFTRIDNWLNERVS